MAGAGFKTFNTGDVLTASDVNTYLMQQTVMVFADASARSTALGANVAEGMLSYLKDTNATEAYNGSSWVNVGNSGDIEGVTAGAGLSGGGTSGTVTLNLATTAAGRNAVINGGFDIWQRGTSSAAVGYQTADRWYFNATANSSGSRETTIVPAGSTYSFKMTGDAGGAGTIWIDQAIETLNAIQFAGKTVVLSAQVAASTSIPMTIRLYSSTSTDNSVTGTWSEITATSGGTATPTSSTFVTISGVYAVPSNAKSLRVRVQTTGNIPSTSAAAYVGQVELELGSVATPFSRAGGTIQGELAACQRYYQRFNCNTGNSLTGFNGPAYSTTAVAALRPLGVPMRVAPTSLDYANLQLYDVVNAANNFTGLALWESTTHAVGLLATGATGLTQYRTYVLFANGTGYVGVSAEL